ncbi:MAG: hypothetical protein HY315_07480 [Acidobacteria bacterium]|nr:hypothetical protein [Acidobacteriota bacterium]
MIDIDQLKSLAARKKTVIRVFGRLDVPFFSINPDGDVDSAVVEIVPEEKRLDFFRDALAHAETFRVEGRFWKRQLNRLEMERMLRAAGAEK